MSTTLNYILKFNSNADKVAASVDKIDQNINKTQRDVKKLVSSFSKGMDKINGKLGGMQMHAFIQNVQSAAQGLESMAAPGLKLTSSLADLQAITDVSDQTLKKLEKSARANAKAFGGDAAQGVESYKLLLSQLNPEITNKPKALEAMGRSVSVLSKTMGGDATAATEVLTTAMNQYQVSTKDPIQASKEMTNMMNIMAAAAKEGSAELPQQKAALEQSGMAAKAAKLRFEEHAAAIQILDKAGKKGAAGGVALRNSLAILSTGRFLPKDVRDELQAAGVDINVLGDKSLDFTERLKPLRKIMNDTALMTKLFGRENSNAALALISGIDAQEELKGKITDTNTAFEQAAIVMDSPAEKAARMRAKIDDLKISMFNATGGMLGYAQVLGQTAFDVSNLIPLFGGFGKMIGFVTNATKMQALWSGIVSGATTVWTAVQWALNAAMSPIILIPLAIMAVVAAIGYVISKTEGWGKAWKHTVNGGKLLFKLFGEGIKLHFMTMVNGMMIGINMIKLGWFKFKNAVGIGDSAENSDMINKIRQDTENRKQAVINQAKVVAETALKAKEEFAKAAGSIHIKKDGTAKEVTPFTITDPNTPGKNNANALGGANGGNGEGTKTNKAIATGGSKKNYITINLKNLIEQMNIKGTDFKDSSRQIQEQSADALIRTLALATTAGN